jgi:hypothetical protein
MHWMRTNITLLILLIAGSVVYGQDVKSPSTQIDVSGIQINDESLPPQSALFFAFQIAGFGEGENVENWQNLSNESVEKVHPSHSGYKRDQGSPIQETYKRDSFKIEPGISLRKLIFPHHFHT